MKTKQLCLITKQNGLFYIGVVGTANDTRAGHDHLKSTILHKVARGEAQYLLTQCQLKGLDGTIERDGEDWRVYLTGYWPDVIVNQINDGLHSVDFAPTAVAAEWDEQLEAERREMADYAATMDAASNRFGY